MGLELQRTKGSEGRAVTGRSSYPGAALGSLRIVDQRISNHLDRSASCCAHPAHNRAINDVHCLNGLYNIRDRSARSLLEKGLRHVGAEDGELQFIVPAPAPGKNITA